MRPQDIATLARRAGAQVRAGLRAAQEGDAAGAAVWLNAAHASLANLDVLLAEKRVSTTLLSLVDEEAPEAEETLPEWMSRRYGDER